MKTLDQSHSKFINSNTVFHAQGDHQRAKTKTNWLYF